MPDELREALNELEDRGITITPQGVRHMEDQIRERKRLEGSLVGNTDEEGPIFNPPDDGGAEEDGKDVGERERVPQATILGGN